MQNLIKTLLFIGIISLLPSCVSHRELVNFQEGPSWDSLSKNIPIQPVLLIQPDDILSITVHSFDMNAAIPYNTNFSSSLNLGTQAGISTPDGYLVDKDGYIDFPVFGRVQIGGLSIPDAKIKIQKLVAQQLVDPVVMVRFLNFRVTVIGEVNHPATFTIPDQKINLLEAVGLAGDLTLYGKRDNILIIREINGKREYGRVNLKSKDFFNSPYFYLAQNDVIYIEPIKQKANTITDETSKILPWLSVAITFITLLITISK